MMLGVIFLGLPIAIFVLLVLLPRGRPALIGVVAVAVLLGLLWLSYLLSVGPFFTGDSHADAFMVAAAAIYTGAWALAAVLQLARGALGEQPPRWLWPLVVVVAALVVGLPALRVLGF